MPSQCPEEEYPPQAPPGHCWGTYIATKYLVQGLVGSLDLHNGLASEIHTAVWESLFQLFPIQLYFFFFLALQEILHLSALSAPRFYFPILFFPLVTRSSVFLLPFLCPHELRSLELTIISKVVVKPSAKSRFFFFPKPWTSVSKHYRGVLVTITGCVEKHRYVSLISTHSSSDLMNEDCPSSKAYKVGKERSLSNQNEGFRQ